MKYSLFRIICIALAMQLASCNTSNNSEKPADINYSVNSKTEAKIDSLLSLMTLEEKVGMIHASSSFTSGGVPRLGIPEMIMSDGPCGVRKEYGRDWEFDNKGDDSATYLPPGIGLAATWNSDLGYSFGKVLGSEAKYRGKDVILGPGVNIFRTPLNGRNYEYLGEDPYLASRMAVGFIKGVQDQGISACVKHYAANNQEFERHKTDVHMSERAFREIYLPAFAAAVKEAEVNTLMGAYNKFRGQWCTHNDYLMNKVLKEELGFKGIVISDWGAVHDTKEALLNGCDLEMGSEIGMNPVDYSKFYMGDTVITLIKNGIIDESVIDDKVRRILRVMIKTNVLNKEGRTPGAFNTKEHQAITLKIAEESITLLKNDQMLPLKKESLKSIAVIGANAERKHAGAGGSAQVNAKYEITALQGIQNFVGQSATIRYSPGYAIEKDKKADPDLIKAAADIAKEADVVIYVGGWIHGYSDDWNDNVYDAESLDKPDMQLPFGQNELIDAVLKANPNTVIVMYGGGPVDMSTFEPKSKAIVQAWYPGMEGGNALANILFGTVSPSGKLPVTFPKKVNDVPAHKLGEYPGNGSILKYNDDIYVGYRYYDTKKAEPLFPFGHGLSYTSFEFTDLKLVKKEQNLAVTVTVKNSGKVQGAEVVQVYVKDEEAAIERPEKELKGFTKVVLEPGKSKQVTVSLSPDAFKYYNEDKKEWVLEPGKFQILVGSSSRDIKLTGQTAW